MFPGPDVGNCKAAERDTVYNEYVGHVGEIVNATVKRIEGPDVIVDIGKAEAGWRGGLTLDTLGPAALERTIPCQQMT